MAAYYRTGQAAKALCVSDHHVRRLCDAGLIEAELTERNHWRISVSEIDRLTEDGVPEFPARPPERVSADACESISLPVLPIAMDATEDPSVRKARSALAVTRTRLEKRKLELEAEQVNDAFRERSGRRKEEREAQEQRQRDAIAAEALRVRESTDAAKRKEWADRHLARALNSLPWNSSGEIRLAVAREAQAVLNGRRHDEDDAVTSRLVDASIHKALFPMRRYEIQSEASRHLPLLLQCESEWIERARGVARAALIDVRDTATDAEMRSLVQHALRPLLLTAEHEQSIRDCVEQISTWLFMKALSDERHKARALLPQELDKLPTDIGRAELSNAAKRVLAPLQVEVEARISRSERTQQADSAVAHAQSLLLANLDEFYEFTDHFEKVRFATKLTPQLQPQIRKAVLRGDLDPSDTQGFVRSWLSVLSTE